MSGHSAAMSAIASLPPPFKAGLEACAAIARSSASPLALFNLGTVHQRAGDLESAEAWFREALALDPDLAEAHQNLAALLQDAGRLAEARRHRDRAFRGRPLRIEQAADEQRRVLLLCGGGYGNVPIDGLLPRRTTTRLKLFVEYATKADWAALPPYDAVFNTIGDADLLPTGTWRLARDVLNPPSRVAPTRRDRLPRLLAGIPHVVVPHAQRRLSGRRVASLSYPVLVRPVGAHGGHGVRLAQTMADTGAGDAYLTEFHDYRSPDGHFRKYRIIFVGGMPFPCHLAISSHWLVHYFSAEMENASWKRAEELCFLNDPNAVLGPRAMEAISTIGRRLGLDYAGIDFSLLPDGRVLVFEANATMIVPRDENPALAERVPDDRHRAHARIFAAFDALLSSSPAAP